MQTSDHAIALARPKGMTPQRVTGLIFAGLLQAALILALIEGLNIKVWPTPVTGTTGTVIKTAPSKPGPPPTLNMHEPTLNNPVEPRFVIDNGQPQQGTHDRLRAAAAAELRSGRHGRRRYAHHAALSAARHSP